VSIGTGEDVRIAEMRGQAIEAFGRLSGAKRTRFAISNLFNFDHSDKTRCFYDQIRVRLNRARTVHQLVPAGVPATDLAARAPAR
jgi:hypothetical protein